MPSLSILKAGLMTSVQDMGRSGLAYYAIPSSGVMDRKSARKALAFLMQDDTYPLIECTSVAPHIRFNNAVQIALAGADFAWTLNNIPIAANGLLGVESGDILKGKFARKAMRAYIAINGKWKIKKVYDSYSTYPNAKIGGLKGRLLQVGDTLEWENNPPVIATKNANQGIVAERKILIRKGPEFDYLSTAARQTLVTTSYKIGTDSNRMGIRLLGKRLESSTYQLQHSLATLPGFVQLPPSGLPIVLLRDGQISGGYPRIAYLPDASINQISQIPLGEIFKFEMR